ncbi:MAG: YjbH domain-containing protein [Rubellimicrobium sp.]|nr:YjbH domain-containing protein [Rubellimicrobium sp.]
MTLRRHLALLATGAAIGSGAAVQAQDRGLTYTLYGTPGLIEMPSALAAADGQVAATAAIRQGEWRVGFTFQITPRLSGTFRYAGLEGYIPSQDFRYYDRSFDLRYQIADEGDLMPAIAVGIQDFMGTGVYSSEYLVASKTIGDSFRVTAGLGWGRLGTYGGFDNPLGMVSDSFNTRPPAYNPGDPGGTVPFDTFFHGDAALFGGVEWAPTDRILVKVEYSSDDGYRDINGEPLLDRRIPLNFGVNWRPRPAYQIGLSYLYGSEIALSGTILFNPHDRPFAMGLDSAPVPVTVRPADVSAALTWDTAAHPAAGVREAIASALAADGFTVESVELTGTTARIRYANGTYRAEAQGLGRVARILTGVLPGSIETITLEPTRQGIPLSAVTFARSDIESLENEPGGTQGAFDRAIFADAGGDGGLVPVPPAERFTWGISPYFNLVLFGRDFAIQPEVGAEISATYRVAPNIIIDGAVRQAILQRDRRTPDLSDQVLPPVRSIMEGYGNDGTPTLHHLTLAWYDRPARNLYSRVTLGYLEPMFGGVSAELLYKPVDARWAVGAELNYAVQRDSDMLFGFGSYSSDPRFADYETVTGHLSFYYAFANQFHGRIDVGRYLAGDWGATVSIDREFENGWQIGAYATATDVSAEDFGVGSFDKGIRISIPLDFVLGTPTRRTAGTTLSSMASDGGARLNVDGRLYDFVREGHVPELEDGWGRFWR